MCKSFFPIITVKLSQKCLSDYKLEVNWPETRKHRIKGCQVPTTDYDFHAVSFDLLAVACVAWRFWLGALRNKGGRGQRNREEVFIFLAASALVLARFAPEFRGYAAPSPAPGSTKPPCYAGYADSNLSYNEHVLSNHFIVISEKGSFHIPLAFR